MSQAEYPKWVTRALGVGTVLVTSSKEEQKLLDDWDTEQLEKAEAEAKAAKELASEAEEAAKVVLKKQGK